MRIQPKGGMSDITTRPAKAAGAKPVLGLDKLTLDASKQLDRALRESPDIRADKVAKARALIENPSYPSAEVIRKVSERLAQDLSKAADDLPGP